MLFALHIKMAQFSWEVAEELVDPRQVKLLEASDGSLVLLPAHLALFCAVLSPCQCCLWNPSPSQICREQTETEEGAAQAVPYVACTMCHSLIGRKQSVWFRGLSGRSTGPHSCGWGAHFFTHPVPGWVFSLFFLSDGGWPEGEAGIWKQREWTMYDGNGGHQKKLLFLASFRPATVPQSWMLPRLWQMPSSAAWTCSPCQQQTVAVTQVHFWTLLI